MAVGIKPEKQLGLQRVPVSPERRNGGKAHEGFLSNESFQKIWEQLGSAELTSAAIRTATWLGTGILGLRLFH